MTQAQSKQGESFLDRFGQSKGNQDDSMVEHKMNHFSITKNRERREFSRFDLLGTRTKMLTNKNTQKKSDARIQ